MGRNMSVPAQPTWLAVCRPTHAAFFRGMKIRLCFPSRVWRKQRREQDLISPRLLGSSCTGGLGAACLASNTSVRGWFQLFAGHVAGGDATTRPPSVLTQLGDHQGSGHVTKLCNSQVREKQRSSVTSFLSCLPSELFNLSNLLIAANNCQPNFWVGAFFFLPVYIAFFVRLDRILKNNNKKPKHEWSLFL